MGIAEVPTVFETSNVEDNQEQLEKLKLLKLKVEANIATLPKVLERMNESIAQCEKLESLNVNIHPIFRRKKSSWLVDISVNRDWLLTGQPQVDVGFHFFRRFIWSESTTLLDVRSVVLVLTILLREMSLCHWTEPTCKLKLEQKDGFGRCIWIDSWHMYYWRISQFY